MKTKKSLIIKILSLLLCTALLFGCQSDNGSNDNTASNDVVTTDETSSDTEDTLSTEEFIQLADEYISEEFSQWDADNAVSISLNGDSMQVEPLGEGASVDGSTLTITAPGTYVLAGTLDDGQVIVNSTASGTVRLVLNGASIVSADSAPIYIKEASETILILADGTANSLEDGEEYIYDDAEEEEPRATIFSKDDLIIAGSGQLTIQANFNDAINGRDVVYIESGKLVILSKDDALVANDAVIIKNGDFDFTAEGAGIKVDEGLYIQSGTFVVDSVGDSMNSSDTILVYGGIFTLSSEDDAVHADCTIQIHGGDFNILDSYEGIESETITITAGNFQINASDDGINVAGSQENNMGGRPGHTTYSDAGDSWLQIDGGNIIVTAAGDGIDANGSIYMTNGTVTINGPTSSANGALDYDGVFEIIGGTLVASGSAGMAQAPSQNSTQYSVSMTYSSVQKVGTQVVVTDEDGNEVISFTPEKDFQNVVISSSLFAEGESYTIGDETILIESITTQSGAQSSGGGMFPTDGGGAPGRERPTQGRERTLPGVDDGTQATQESSEPSVDDGTQATQQSSDTESYNFPTFEQ